jgi:hypothetical protein
MFQSGKASRAGGAIIAATILGGAMIGTRLGQPSLGTVIGAALGTTITIAIFLYDLRR